MKEIGSEFWSFDRGNSTYFDFEQDTALLMSGRTALDFIIKDIKGKKNIKSAYLPSYCCISMIQPFLDNGVEVEFYDVVYKKSKGLSCDIDIDKEFDIVYLIDYFGFINPQTRAYEKKLGNLGKSVIKDMTHSVFSEDFKSEVAYTFASFRKWTALSGGAFAYKKGGFCRSLPQKTNEEYVLKRKTAANKKSLYMSGEFADKDSFLHGFALAEEILDKDYADYSIDLKDYECIKHINANFIKRKRRENAMYLLNGLKETRLVSPLYLKIAENEIPLFVPVRVENGLRNELRRYLVENKIYLPVHWPVCPNHKLTNDTSDLYECGLSIVCDQRYGTEDMDYIIKMIRKFEVERCL